MTLNIREELTPCLMKNREQSKMKTAIAGYKRKIANRKLIVDLFAIFFGIGAWIGVNGMFVQLPLLVEALPEGWNLPSYMSVAVQLANIGPLFYAILRKFITHDRLDSIFIYCILIIGTVTAFLMSSFYGITMNIGGEESSFAFLIMCFFTALVGCTSSVLFFPYIRHFKDIYLITYLIGEGLSGFIPSTIALIQGVGGNPECSKTVHPNGTVETELIYHEARFGVRYFFICIGAVLTLSFFAFYLLNNLKYCRTERVSANADKQTDDGQNAQTQISRVRYASLLVLMAIMCGVSNGFFPSIQSYSCLPYGNTAYHLAVTLGNMANPLACFIAMFLPRTSNRAIVLLTLVCSLFTAYVTTASLMSPMPPLIGNIGGEIIIVVAWIFVIGLISYIKLSISTVFRSVGGSAMFHCGAVTQIGSAVTSIVTFFLINYANIFQQSDPCL